VSPYLYNITEVVYHFLECLWTLIFGLMMMIVSTCTRSAANILFFNADEAPLLDVYIKSASRSSTKEIVTIPPIDGSKQDWNKIVRCNRGTE
jgi:hypothetical protein